MRLCGGAAVNTLAVSERVSVSGVMVVMVQQHAVFHATITASRNMHALHQYTIYARCAAVHSITDMCTVCLEHEIVCGYA